MQRFLLRDSYTDSRNSYSYSEMIPTEKFLLIYSYAKAPKQYAMIPVLFLIFVKIPYQKVGFLRQAFTLIFCPGKEKEWRF